MEFLDTPDGARIAWDSVGEGPSVLLVHGIGYTRAKWEPQVAPLVEAGYRVIRFDLRGFGESTMPSGPSNMSEFLADLELLVDALDAPPLHIVGHSLGGMIAQRYVLERRSEIRTLTLVSTMSHNGRRGSAFARLMVTFSEHGFDEVLNEPALRADAEAILKEAFPAGVALSMLRPGLEQPNLARANAWRACIGFSVKDELSRMGVPALVVHGTADRLIPFKAGQLVAEAIPGSRFLAEEGAGHSLPKERAPSFNRAFVAFLEAHERSRRSVTT